MFAQIRSWARQLKSDVVAVYFSARDPRCPWPVRLLAMPVAAYALSPLDLIPDFIPVLGYLDDVILLPGLIWLIVRVMPAEVRDACRLQTQDWMAAQQRKPVSRWGIASVLGVWVLVAWGLWRWWGL